MTESTPPAHGAPRRASVGLLVVSVAVLASFVWWLLTPAPRRPAPAPETPAARPAPVTEPAPPTPAVPSRTTPAPTPKTSRPSGTPPAPAAAPGSARPLLRVSGDVAGADVFVDRTFVGKTPFESRDITAGSHQLNISAPGFDGVSKRIDVLADAPTEVSFALKAVVLNASVDVVHEHRFGSCEGRLVADLSGLRYAPSKGDHGFATSLSGLTGFEVAYREKLLRVKLASGRNFSFTTRAPNADPLFVFHRDVEKARAKLAAGGGR